MTTHPYDDIEAFALGTLDEGNAAAVLEHADACATCAVLMAETMRAASALEPDAVRPLAFKTNRAARLPAPSGFGPIAWVACLATAAAIALLVWNAHLRSSALPVPVASLVHSHFEHHPLRGASGAGAAKVIQALDGSWLYLVADGLRPNSTYTLWDSVSGVQREVGTFQSDVQGQAAAFWQRTPAKIQAFDVSLGGTPPNGPTSLHWP